MTPGSPGTNKPLEIDGPPTAYFEIPLDHSVYGLEHAMEGMGNVERAVQRIQYESFACPLNTEPEGDAAAKVIVGMVRAEVMRRGGGIIWWRRRPVTERYGDGKQSLGWRMHMRLATSPSLPTTFWREISANFDNIHHEWQYGETAEASRARTTSDPVPSL